MTIKEELKKYKDLITGIIIDRGEGDEYFKVIGVCENSQGEIFLNLDRDTVNEKWLESCNTVKLLLKGQVTIIDDIPYIITVRKSELEQTVNLLMDVYDRLCEVSEVPSIIDNSELLKEKVWELKKKVQAIVRNEYGDISKPWTEIKSML